MKIWFVIGAFLLGATAHAARTARVLAPDTLVRDRPLEKAQVIRTLRKGTPVVASNFPTESFHKVRLGDGTVGWIKTVDLALGELPEEYR